MNPISRNIAAITLTGVWVNISEFLRNEIFLKSYWLDHYQSLGIIFPSEPSNGAIWGLWGFLFATAIFLVSRKFTLAQTTLICWLMGFVLMWIVAWNLRTLPIDILAFAIPLSLLETFIGSYLCNRISPSESMGPN